MDAFDREFLRAVLSQACRPRPPDWHLWTLDGLSFPLGLMPTERAEALARAMPSHMPLMQKDQHWIWYASHCTAEERSAALHDFVYAQRMQGLLSGWRNEAYACWGWRDDIWPYPEPALFSLERAGFRHLGLRSHASHVHGIDACGHMWCGRRALDKATDPGMLDNLAAGGLPAGEEPYQCAVREILEEAGLQRSLTELHGPPLQLLTEREEEEGWHSERLFVFSIQLTEGEYPINRDGEVMEFLRLSYSEAMGRMRSGDLTVDAACAIAVSILEGELQKLGFAT